ncbi:hypothetical protein AAFF_G00386440 [Aldrovandia affinis]|uniref:CCHC-type domain-containing protein n=1 Tax=Aldrovandia affinis TaxID=143900 RepID=A0AAD7WLR6_9TELE|nr:hypothetical protein AAFF_G00386440 [Aldrovandia affinis]
MRTATADDNVMGARVQPRKPAMTGASERGTESVDIVCFRCGQRGHKARVCQRGQQWYRQRQDNARGVSEETDENTYAFLVSETQPGHGVTRKGLMVDTGATSHIITDLARFKSFDDRFQAETHCVELADGTRCKGVAERRGDEGGVFGRLQAAPRHHTEAGIVHPLLSSRHLLRESCNFQWGDGDLQGRRRRPTVQRRHAFSHL